MCRINYLKSNLPLYLITILNTEGHYCMANTAHKHTIVYVLSPLSPCFTCTVPGNLTSVTFLTSLMMSEMGEVSVVKGEVSILLSAIRRSNRWVGHPRIVSWHAVREWENVTLIHTFCKEFTAHASPHHTTRPLQTLLKIKTFPL